MKTKIVVLLGIIIACLTMITAHDLTKTKIGFWGFFIFFSLLSLAAIIVVYRLEKKGREETNRMAEENKRLRKSRGY